MPAPRRYRLSRLILKIYGLYLLITIGVVMPLLNAALKPLYLGQTGRELTYQLVGFNPFTLGLFGYGLADHNPDGSLLWGVQNLQLNPSLVASARYGAIGIDEVRLMGLEVHLEQTHAHGFNFSDILTHRKTLAPETPPQAEDAQAPFTLPRLWIGEFELDARQLAFTDSARNKPFTTGLKDFHFILNDFSTLNPEGDGYKLKATSAQGGQIEWRGDIATTQAKTWGEFSLSHFSLIPLWQFMEPQLNFALHQGELNLRGHYEFDWSDGVQWRIKNTQIAVDHLNLTQQQNIARGLPPSTLRWDSLNIQIVGINSKDRQADVATVALSGLNIRSGHSGARVGLADTFALKNQKAAQDEPQYSGTPAQPINPWQLNIGEAQLRAASTLWRVPELDDRDVKLSPINLTLKGFNLGKAPANFTASLSIDDTATLTSAGQLTLQDQSLTVNSSLENLPLAWANPLVDNQLLAKISTGHLALSNQLVIAQGTLTQARAGFTISDLLITDHKQLPLASAESIALDELVFNAKENHLAANRLSVNKLSGALQINADGTTNIQALLKAQPRQPTQAQPQPTLPAHKPLQWQLNEVLVQQAQVDFTDQTPLSTFSTRIQSLDGKITHISSEANTPWVVDLKGNVDGYAPVDLRGSARPLLREPAMDMALNFTAMDLAVFNPYSTTFTGWHIEKGLLSVHLQYQLQDARIVGANQVILDQLTLGERVDSHRLLDIPLRLALALLTDEQGVADLSVPVKGTTDDPNFSLAEVIWSALRNSIMKLVTAPFNLLASLVGSEEDLGEISFAPLSSELSPAAKAKLHTLSKALELRPQLQLEISGDINHRLESNALKQQQLNEHLLAAGLTQADIDKHTAQWRRAAYARLKLSPSGTEPDAPALQAQLLAQIPEPTAALQALKQARALNTKQYLVQALAMDPTQLFTKSDAGKCPRNDRCNKARAVFGVAPGR
ncbi:DUF748 domain-containing protein [Simiduia sp. 21SJ11W-1]|uniref:DUF748 domain-containing protein n=1 Tax=Simiduia sp. 21SJ11W-1 TaxID=2909669 RepID=UPI00209DC9B5|nr:DUF748 domain-containing protein [Simiduia sp. 21SJ11W-1]UTA46473.1 DUF748 domain-containing protein [Simiduia sp. 21SJ11W-1]